MNITIVVSLIAGLSWIVVIALLAITVLRASRHQSIKASTTALVLVAILAIVLNTISAGLVFIQPQERGVVISALQEGVRPE
jgi:hypothetical protein